MPSIDELARVLGGALRSGVLVTHVGDLRVLVIERPGFSSPAPSFELQVVVPDLEMDEADWLADTSIPSLQHGYMFVGYRHGVLIAVPRTLDPPTLEQIVTTLWELVGFARQPWVRDRETEDAARRRRRRERWRRVLRQLAIIAICLAIGLLVRWVR